MAVRKAILKEYARAVTALAQSPSSNEATYYPALQSLLKQLLRERGLPFDVRTNTSQSRPAGGADQPDLAFYDGAGDFATVLGEVKTPRQDLEGLAGSQERKDQVGRYLARTGVVLLTNVRGFGLLTVSPEHRGDGPVPPEHRQLLEHVELWPSASAVEAGMPTMEGAGARLAELLEAAVTEFAPIGEPESLARILARQARRAKAGLPEKFSQAVRPLLEDFAKALGLHFEGDEGEEFLRSSLIQTAFYSLFAGWTLWRYSQTERPFRWREVGEYLKIPFLGGLFYEFQHPARLKELGLGPHLDLAEQTLKRVDAERFFSRFTFADFHAESDRNAAPASGAILYFYEPFLEAFDPDLRKELGVWYTPPEIVRYQVRRADRLLREELGCARGFADERVVVLDPCCGTGAYLIEVVRTIENTLVEEGAGAVLAASVLRAVCRRVIGFEILTAPFVVAQLQLYLILSEMGLEPDEDHRPAVYLTNALTGWHGPDQLKLNFPELQQEHDAAHQVKREAPIIVILGNPPYNRFAGVPLDEEADLVDHYKGIVRDEKGKQVGNTEIFRRFGVRKHLLDDLYVRFFRLAEARIGERAEHGIVTYISNSSFLGGRSHPLMRESLLQSFHTIWIDNLHGDRNANERTPQGDSCQTIFSVPGGGSGIKVGTSITTLLKRDLPPTTAVDTAVFNRDFWGSAALKRQALLDSLRLEEVSDEQRQQWATTPAGPRGYTEVEPTEKRGWKLIPVSTVGGYEDWPGVDELFEARFQGVNPNRGLHGSIIDTDLDSLRTRMQDYYSDTSFEALAGLYPELCAKRARYSPNEVRKKLQEDSNFQEDNLASYLLFPLDTRHLYYEPREKLLNERRPKLWDNLEGNAFLLTVPEPRRPSESRPLLTHTLFDLHVHDRGSVGFPALIRPDKQERDLFNLDGPESPEPHANLSPSAWEVLKERWRLDGDRSDPAASELVKHLFHLALAIGHSPAFQNDHRDNLAQDWLRLPIPKTYETFRRLASRGAEVAVLLDPLADASVVLDRVLGAARARLAKPATRNTNMVREGELVVAISHYGAARGGWRDRALRDDEPTFPAWGEGTGDLHLNDTVYLEHVPPKVWRFALGGYPVIKKWLGYRDAGRRPERGLSLDELDHLRGMVQRLAALLLLHDDLDSAYEQAIEAAFTSEELGLS